MAIEDSHRENVQDESFGDNCIYRFFPEKWQAEKLTKGNIWISTLETCRKHENSAQGDSGEGTMTYNSGAITGDGDDSDVQLIANRLRISMGPAQKDLTMKNNTSLSRLHDAYILCTTDDFLPEKLSDDFGQYCVKINNPRLFFQLATEALENKHEISESAIRKVIYTDRFYKHTDNAPGPIWLVKPKDQYCEQSEVRLMWTPKNIDALKPFSLV